MIWHNSTFRNMINEVKLRRQVRVCHAINAICINPWRRHSSVGLCFAVPAIHNINHEAGLGMMSAS